MANFDTSNLLTAQTIVSNRYKQPEMRMKPAPAFTLLSGNDNFLIVGAETLKTRDDRTIEAHLLARTKRSSSSARAYNHTGTLDDSQKVTLTWTTKSDKTTISLKLLDKSVLDFNTVLANKLEQCCMNILEDKETEAIAYLRAQRTTQSQTLQGATWNAGNTSYEIDGINATQFYQRVRSIMRQNYFPDQLDVVTDSLMSIAAQYQVAQGPSNSTNLEFQFPGINRRESIELSDANYPGGIVLAMPQGSVAALNWIPKQNRTGWGDYNSYVGGYGTFDFMGFTFALHGYAQRADTSGTNGNAQDVTMEFELSLDSSYNVSPLNYTTNRVNSVVSQFAQMAP